MTLMATNRHYVPLNVNTQYDLWGSCAKKIKPEFDQASKSNYQFVGNTGAGAHVKWHHRYAISKIKTEVNSTG